MKSKSKLHITNGKEEDIEVISKLLYKTEDYPEDEWGRGKRDELLVRLKKLMKRGGTRFYYDNFRVLKLDKEIIGIALSIEGKKLKKKTFLADLFVIRMQKSLKEKIRFVFLTLVYLLDFECFFYEYYLSNIIIKEEFRGKGYSEILIRDVLDTAKEKGYLKVSLRANNEKLVKFYERLGFKRVNSKSKKLIKKI